MHALKPIAFDVLISMSQLFEYYMYAVSNNFNIYFSDKQ